MPPDSVVEDLDVLEDLASSLRSRVVPAEVLKLGLERTEEALRHRVVPAVALPAHACEDPALAELPAEFLAGVLAAASWNKRPDGR